ncbi:hypothetical protein J43TS9_29270 [Paenibacillus cineris]|nr:hypothetical protein J43TS9_29270 [Paenibacillus cineris]
MMLDRVWRDRDKPRTSQEQAKNKPRTSQEQAKNKPRANLEFTRHILFGFSLT